MNFYSISKTGDNSHTSFNIEDFKYSKNLYSLTYENANITGDISVFSGLSNLQTINLMGCGNVTGDISAFKDLSKFTYLNIKNTNLTGDIASISSYVRQLTC